MMKIPIVLCLIACIALAAARLYPTASDAVSIDEDALDAALDASHLPDGIVPRGRTLQQISPYQGCVYYAGQVYYGDSARVYSIEMRYRNQTTALETCCRLCWHVRGCGKITLTRNLLSIGSQGSYATCAMFTRQARRRTPTRPPDQPISFFSYTAGLLRT